MAPSPSSLLDEFESIVTKYHDIPHKMVKAAGYFVVSSALGRRVRITKLPNFYGWPNVFFILGSEPALTHRSTLHRIVDHVLRETYVQEHTPPDGEESDRRTLEEDFSRHLIESATVEGIADHIAETAFDNYMVVSSEYGYTISQAVKTSSYTFGIASIFSKLYYGEPWSQHLSNRNGRNGFRSVPPGIFLNMFVSMQNLELYLNDLLLKQGFLRRACLVPVESSELDPSSYRPALDDDRGLIWGELDSFSVKLAQAIDHVSHWPKASNLSVLGMDQNVTESINEYDRENYTRAIEEAKRDSADASPWNQYAISRWEYMVKLSAIEALSEVHPVIEARHLQVARSFLDSLEAAQKRVITSVAFGPSERKELPFMTANLAQRQILEAALGKFDGYFKYGTVKAVLNTTDTRRVAQLIDLLESKEYIETIIETSTAREEANRILPEGARSLVPSKGQVPTIYKVTDAGKNWIMG